MVLFLVDPVVGPRCYVQGFYLRTALCSGRARSESTLHVGQDQPNPRLTLSPIPDLNLNRNFFGGSRSAGAVTRLHRDVFPHNRAAEKGQPLDH